MEYTDLSERYFLPNEVDVELYMLGTPMVNGIRCHVHRRDVVAVDNGRLRHRCAELAKQLASALATAQYSASALERETVGWRFEDQQYNYHIKHSYHEPHA
jgi:hypothetical protein